MTNPSGSGLSADPVVSIRRSGRRVLVDYDAPNYYCKDAGDWPPGYTCFNNVLAAGDKIMLFENGSPDPSTAAWIYFDSGTWNTGIDIPCPGSGTYTAVITYKRQGNTTASTNITQSFTLAVPCDAPDPQNGHGCPNPSAADGPFGTANGPGNVPIGVHGAPAFAESPISGPLAPVFFYNGNDLTTSTGVSPGWFFSYGETLITDSPGRLVWTDATGFHRYYTGDDVNGYVASYPGEAEGTVALVGGDYVLSQPDGSSRAFVASGGFWRRTKDRWGNGAQGNSSSSGRATVVEELQGGIATGRQISLGYSSGRLTSVTDAASGVTELGYDSSGRLATVCTAEQTCPPTVPALPWRTLGYDGTTSRLTSIKDAGGFVVRGYSWNAAGGVASTWIGATTYASGKERATFTESGSTVLVSRYIEGTSTADTTYTVETIAGVNRVTHITGACPECGAENSTSTFDAVTGRLLTRSDGNSHVTTRGYDAYGNLTSVVEALATPVERTTTYDFAVPGVDLLPTTWPPSLRNFWKKKTEPSGVKPGFFVETTRSFGGTDNLVLTETVSGYLTAGDTSPTPRQTITTFDSLGRVLSVDGPRTDVSDITTLEYYPASEPILARRNRLSRRVEPDLTETIFDTYHALGGVMQDTRKLRSGASDADVVTERTFDARGRIVTRTLKATSAAETDILTTTGYDSRGRVDFTQVAPSGGAVTTRTNFAYEDGTDRLLSRTLTTTAGGAGDRITYGYDDRGNIASESYGHFDGNTTTTVDYVVNRSYDGRCRPKSQTYPADSATTSYTYDCVGNLKEVTDSLHTSPNLLYGYDARNRLSTVTRTASPSNDTTDYDYDARDQLIQVTDPNGAATFYAFDDFGQMREKTTALSGGSYGDIATYNYDAAGNLISESNAERGTIRTWDAAGRLLTVTNAQGSPALSIVHTYDTGCDADPLSGHVFGQGRLCSVVDETGTTTFAYDRRGLVTSQHIDIAASEVEAVDYGPITYRYDAAGRQLEVVSGGGTRILSTFDGAGRVTSLAWQESGGSATTLLSSITHKAFGPVTGFITSGGVTESRSYDTRYRRQAQSTSSAGVTRLSLAYDDGATPPVGWDKEGHLLALRDTTPGAGSTFDRTFGYDPGRYFLNSSVGPYGSSWAQQTLSWTYDRTGNRLTETRSGIGTWTYGYHNDGSAHSNGVLASITPPGGSSKSVTSLSTGDLDQDDESLLYSYDALGRLTMAQEPLLPRVQALPADAHFHHDYRNLRVIRTSRPRRTVTPPYAGWHFLYGQDGSLFLESRRLPGGLSAGTWFYAWLEGEPIAVLAAPWEKGSGRLVYFLHDDHLGRPIGMTDATGALVWRPEYEPFGKSLAPRRNEVHGPGFRFPGQWESEESADLPGGDAGLFGRIGALTDNWHRTYVQRWGRYTQPDPIGLKGGLNLFSYAAGRPTSMTDRFGLVCAVYWWSDEVGGSWQQSPVDHRFFTWPGGGAGFQPDGGGEGIGVWRGFFTSVPAHTSKDVPNPTYDTKHDTFWADESKCGDCRNVHKCLQDFVIKFTQAQNRWCVLGKNCHTFVDDAFAACGLSRERPWPSGFANCAKVNGQWICGPTGI